MKIDKQFRALISVIIEDIPNEIPSENDDPMNVPARGRPVEPAGFNQLLCIIFIYVRTIKLFAVSFIT